MGFVIKYGVPGQLKIAECAAAQDAIDLAESLKSAGAQNLTIQIRQGGEKFSVDRFKNQQGKQRRMK